MKKITAIYINAESQRIEEREIDGGDYREINRAIGCDVFTFAHPRGLKGRDAVAVDDEGLIYDPTYGFRIGGQALAGNGLVLGVNAEGESTTPKTSLLDVAILVQFVRFTEKK
jgi:hypothetical protein